MGYIENDIKKKYLNPSEIFAWYKNTEEINNLLHKEYSAATNSIEFLKSHRDFIERNNLGFGDRAFHFMWFLLLSSLSKTNNKLSLLEIGVYKGQVISLWSVIAKALSTRVDIGAISPFEGNYQKPKTMLGKLLNGLSLNLKNEKRVGNLYAKEDYMQIIKNLFGQFQISLNNVTFMKGKSTDSEILIQLESKMYDIIYVDGDHSFDGVSKDIINFAPKVIEGGYLVMDDASCNIPGGGEGIFWKGHQSVSDACEIIENLGFENVLNVGHNRVYRKL